MTDPQTMTREQLIDALAAARFERTLLGAARRALDNCVAATDEHARAAAVIGAAELAQRIIDEIGHPATAQATLGPYYRDVLADIITRTADTQRTPDQRLYAIRSICVQALRTGDTVT